jgi:DNA-binding CsgD family transcriptional regulator
MTETETTAPYLTPLQRRVAEQRALGRSRREIALLLGVTVQAVKKHLTRARKRAIDRQPALRRYALAMSQDRKVVHFQAFPLLPTDHA